MCPARTAAPPRSASTARAWWSGISDQPRRPDQHCTPAAHAFIYDPTSGSYTDITAPDAVDLGSGSSAPSGTFATGISNSGQVVGNFAISDLSDSLSEGFLYDPTQASLFTDIAPTGASTTTVTAINDTGEIVGDYEDSGNAWHGFRYDIATQSYTTIDHHAAVNGTFFQGINDAGRVVGYYEDAANQKHAFLYDSAGGTFADINDPAPTDTDGSVAESINAQGRVLGYYLDSRNDQIWFVYDSARNTFTQVNDPAGFSGSTVAAIDDAGDIAGTFDQGSGPQPFIASLFQPETVSLTVSIADNSGAILAFGAQRGTSFTLSPGQLGQLKVIAQQPGFHGLVALNITGTGIEEDGSTTSTTSTMSVPALGPVTDPVIRWDQVTLQAIAHRRVDARRSRRAAWRWRASRSTTRSAPSTARRAISST